MATLCLMHSALNAFTSLWMSIIMKFA
jgi:hypothetical protein